MRPVGSEPIQRVVSAAQSSTLTPIARNSPESIVERLAVHDVDARVRLAVGELAEREQLVALPAAPYPAAIEQGRTVGPSSLVAFRRNR